eukprot:3613422-Rhodomonas_salina.1
MSAGLPCWLSKRSFMRSMPSFALISLANHTNQQTVQRKNTCSRRSGMLDKKESNTDACQLLKRKRTTLNQTSTCGCKRGPGSGLLVSD